MAAAKPLKHANGSIVEMGATDVIPIANLATGTPDGTKFVRDDGTLASPGAPSGGAGTTTLDFGASPGTAMASVDVTGLGTIGAGSRVQAWVVATATADHSADEHVAESLKIVAGNVVAGVGFTIYGEAMIGFANGTFTVAYSWS